MPGITDPSEQYFKDGLWGWDGSQWRKLPLVWGYSEDYSEKVVESDVPAGSVTIDLSTVPAGEVWVIQRFLCTPSQVNITRMRLQKRVSGTAYDLRSITSFTAYNNVVVDSVFSLPAGANLRVSMAGAQAGDDFVVTAAGYKMKVAE